KDRRDGPRSELDLRVEIFRQNARNVVGESAAGDMRHRVNRAAVDERYQRLEIRDVRLQQSLADLPDAGNDRLRVVSELIEKNPPRERVAIGVQSGGRNSDQDVAFANGFAFNEEGLVDDPHDEAGDVVVVIAIEAGHFGSLAADERAAVFLARA